MNRKKPVAKAAGFFVERPTMNDQALNAEMTTFLMATQPMMVRAATTKGVMKTKGLFWRMGMALKIYVKM